MKSNNKQIVLGVFAICIPLIMGLIIWPDIKTIFSSRSEQIYIYYELEGHILKIPVGVYKKFEADVPEAEIQLTLNGEYYSVPIKEKHRFIQLNGADNVTLCVVDEENNVVPELSNIYRVPGY